MAEVAKKQGVAPDFWKKRGWLRTRLQESPCTDNELAKEITLLTGQSVTRLMVWRERNRQLLPTGHERRRLLRRKARRGNHGATRQGD